MFITCSSLLQNSILFVLFLYEIAAARTGHQPPPSSSVMSDFSVVNEEVMTTKVVKRSYVREIAYLEHFKDKVGGYKDPRSCIRDCEREVCTQSAGK